MPFNLLLFPLIGGYYILIRFRYLRYVQYRLESQRILLNSAFAGILLLGACFILRAFFIAIWPETVEQLSKLLPIHAPYFGTTSLSLLVAVAATEIANELKTDLVLKADKINSISFFDMDMYNRFNPSQEETP